VVDGGDALKRMEERSQQTKKIVGGVVGAGVGALAVGILGGVLGKRAADVQQQQLRGQQAGGVGGMRGTGGLNLDAGSKNGNNHGSFAGAGGTRGMGGILGAGNLDAGSTNGDEHGSFTGTVSGSSADTASSSFAVGVTNGSASELHGLGNGSANSTVASDNDSGLVVPDTSLHQTGNDTAEHTLMWWWIPLLLLLCLGIWCLRKKVAQDKSTREFKAGKQSRKRGAGSGMNINIPESPASSACSEAPMLQDVSSPKGIRMQQMRSSQVGVQEGASASMQVGGDLFDAIDTNHDGVIDKAEFDRAMGVRGGNATMLAGGRASMVAAGSGSMWTGGSNTGLRQQQQRARSMTPPRCHPGSPRGTWMVYEGASATMPVGGSGCMSPGSSVSIMPAGASVSVMPAVSTSTYPVTLSPGASVSVMPPAGSPRLQYGKSRHMFTGTTVSSPSKMRSMTPPPSYGRQSAGLVMPYLRSPPLI